MNSHFLYPAALYASSEPCIINTILGSCIAVCLWDQVIQKGGMAHYMLPLWNGEGLASPKYGNIAIDKLLEKLQSMGCQKKNIKAKIFGGGEVIDNQTSFFNVGRRNMEIAFEILKEKGIPIIGKSTGGKLGRKIIFNTYTGEVRQRYVQRQVNS